MPSSSSCNRVVVRTRSASRKLHLVAREVRIGLQDGLGATFLRAFAHGELSVPAAQKEVDAMSRRASRFGRVFYLHWWFLNNLTVCAYTY